jgi:hypothetical protein
MNSKSPWAFLALFCCITSFSSCFHHFYKTNTSYDNDSAAIKKLVEKNRIFIVHANKQASSFWIGQVKSDSIVGDIDTLPPEHRKHLYPKKAAGNRYRVKEKEFVLSEVHLYTKDTTVYNGHCSIPLKNIYQINVYGPDKEATNRACVLSAIGLTVLTGFVIVAIIFAVDPAFAGPWGGPI